MKLNNIFAVATYFVCLTSLFTTDVMAAEKGYASYYANRFQGQKTANGQRYDKNKLTAAHKNLDFGSKVKVTNLDNNQSVIVTITDRGPASKKRVIDLSYAAAEQLDLIDSGVARVKVTVLKSN